MKITRTLIFFLLLILPQTLHSQVPGYLGKKLYLTLGVSLGPALEGPTQNNNGSDFFGASNKRSFGLNYEFDGALSYVVGRYSSVGISAGQYYTGAISEASTISPFFTTNSSLAEFDEHELFWRLNVRSINLIHSLYKRKKGALAPFGNYFYYGLGRKFISGSVIDKKTDYWASEVFGNTELKIDDEISYTSIFIGWGSQQIFWDKVILKWGVKISFPLNYVSWRAIDLDTNQGQYTGEAFSRIYSHEVARFDIGIGYLLF